MKWNKQEAKAFKNGFKKAVSDLLIVFLTTLLAAIFVFEIIALFQKQNWFEEIWPFMLVIFVFLVVGVIGGILSVRKQRKNQIES